MPSLADCSQEDKNKVLINADLIVNTCKMIYVVKCSKITIRIL